MPRGPSSLEAGETEVMHIVGKCSYSSAYLTVQAASLSAPRLDSELARGDQPSTSPSLNTASHAFLTACWRPRLRWLLSRILRLFAMDCRIDCAVRRLPFFLGIGRGRGH